MIKDLDKGYDEFRSVHETQLLSSGVPQRFWLTLNFKLQTETFDAGEVFQILVNPSTYTKKVVMLEDMNLESDSHIYLIDHAYIYEAGHAVSHMRALPHLVERLKRLMSLDTEDFYEIEREMWKLNQTFSIASGANAEDRLPLWYLMDEFGCSIQHSDSPNFRIVPFAYAPTSTTFSLLFPIKTCQKGEEVTRDYIEGVSDPLIRRALLYPWEPSSFRDISYCNISPSQEYLLQGKMPETLPKTEEPVCISEPVKVYSEYEYIRKYLKDPKFKIVSSPSEADVVWYSTHFRDFEKLSLEHPKQLINQFPFENILTVKSLLSSACQDGNYSWFLTTYNLKTELPQFISYFQYREDKKLDNTWICKPWNLARGMDTYITADLSTIIRQSTASPKLAQKYIHKPILFLREDVGQVKFDIRYVILLRSTAPLELFVYKKFFLRFANVPFSLEDFSNYQKHFTVMNYTDAPLFKLLCDDFIVEFDHQNQHTNWKEVQNDIFSMFQELFECVTKKPPPFGIPSSLQSRAVYAVDLMLEDDDGIKPKLLEVNWMPDCQRACEYYPSFYDDIFSSLFLNMLNDNIEQIL